MLKQGQGRQPSLIGEKRVGAGLKEVLDYNRVFIFVIFEGAGTMECRVPVRLLQVDSGADARVLGQPFDASEVSDRSICLPHKRRVISQSSSRQGSAPWSNKTVIIYGRTCQMKRRLPIYALDVHIRTLLVQQPQDQRQTVRGRAEACKAVSPEWSLSLTCVGLAFTRCCNSASVMS